MEESASDTEDLLRSSRILVRDLLEYSGQGKKKAIRRRKLSSVEWYTIFSKKKGKKHFRKLLHIDHPTFFILTSYLYHNGGAAVEEVKRMNVSFATVVARGVLSMSSRGTVEANASIMMCSTAVYIKSVNLFISMLLHVKSKIIVIPPKENFRYFKTNVGEVFKGAVLAIDGTHIRLDNHMPIGGMFLNRKKYPSLNTLVVTDWNMNFVFVDAKWPGAACDITVWKNSALCKALRNDKNSILPKGCFILSDKGYRNTHINLSPFFKNEVSNDLTPEECKHYDEIHRITRSSVERAIGKLKARVPMLSKGLYKKSAEDAVEFVYAAVTFHQLCRYIELALYPTPSYIEHMKTHAADIPEFDTPDGTELRNKVIQSIATMREK